MCPKVGSSLISALVSSVLGVAVSTAIFISDGIIEHSLATLNPVYKLSPRKKLYLYNNIIFFLIINKCELKKFKVN